MSLQDYQPAIELEPAPAPERGKGQTSLLVIGMNYAPEPTGNAPYTTKLAEGLARLGHRVDVLTGYPHYPDWRVAEGYSGTSRREMLNGVPVRRLRHSVPAKPTALTRLLMELTFGLHTILRRWGKHDVVLVVSPGLFAAACVVAKARIIKTPVAIWVQDLYSRGLAETGAGATTIKIMKRIESTVLSACSRVTVIHSRFRDYVINELAVPRDKVEVIRNWTHIRHTTEFDRTAVRERLGWRPDETIALHAGNMGIKQGLENVVEAARLSDLSGSGVRFVLLGGGNRRNALEAAGKGVSLLSFLDPLDDDEYSQALRAADVLIVNERPELREMSVPSKLTSYFATGLPVVAATHSASATADEIMASGAGLVVDPERPSALLREVELLRDDPAKAVRLGSAGPPYAASILSESTAMDSYSSLLARVIASSDQPAAPPPANAR